MLKRVLRPRRPFAFALYPANLAAALRLRPPPSRWSAARPPAAAVARPAEGVKPAEGAGGPTRACWSGTSLGTSLELYPDKAPRPWRTSCNARARLLRRHGVPSRDQGTS